MYLVGWVDEATQTTTGISIPCLLSFLAYQDIHATVAGHRLLRAGTRPRPSTSLFQVYHFMIRSGAAAGRHRPAGRALYLWKRRLYESRFVLWLLVLTVFIGEIADHRRLVDGRDRPPAVGRLQRAHDGRRRLADAQRRRRGRSRWACSSALYALLLVLFLFLLNRKIQARAGAELEDVETVADARTPADTFRDDLHAAGRSRAARRGRAADEPRGHLVRAVHPHRRRLPDPRRLRHGRRHPAHPGGARTTSSGGRSSTASARSGTATRSGWCSPAASCSPSSRSPTPRCSRASTSRSCSCCSCLILRTVAHRVPEQGAAARAGARPGTPSSRLASTGLAFLLGVAFGNVVSGRADRRRAATSRSRCIDLLNPFALLVGVTTVAMFAMHGALYLLLKTEGELHDRIRAAVPRLMVVFFVLNTVRRDRACCCSSDADHRPLRRRHLARHLPGRGAGRARRWPGGWSGAGATFAGVPVLVGDDRACCSSRAGSGSIPNLIISTTDPAYNLTIYNAAAADNTLVVAPDRRAHRDAVRAALHRRRLLHLPRQDRGRLARLLRASRGRSPDPVGGSHAADRTSRARGCWRLDRAARTAARDRRGRVRWRRGRVDGRRGPPGRWRSSSRRASSARGRRDRRPTSRVLLAALAAPSSWSAACSPVAGEALAGRAAVAPGRDRPRAG